MFAQIEMPQLLVIGDFNINAKNKEDNTFNLLTKICKQLGLRIEIPNEYTHNGAILDFMVCGKNIKILEKSCIVSPSDHKAIRWTIEILPKETKTIKSTLKRDRRDDYYPTSFK